KKERLASQRIHVDFRESPTSDDRGESARLSAVLPAIRHFKTIKNPFVINAPKTVHRPERPTAPRDVQILDVRLHVPVVRQKINLDRRAVVAQDQAGIPRIISLSVRCITELEAKVVSGEITLHPHIEDRGQLVFK